MSEYEIIKTFLQNVMLKLVWKLFVIKRGKNTVWWTNVISHLDGGEIAGTFYEKDLQKTNQKEFRIDGVIKRKGVTLYVKSKGYNNSLNSWIYIYIYIYIYICMYVYIYICIIYI